VEADGQETATGMLLSGRRRQGRLLLPVRAASCRNRRHREAARGHPATRAEQDPIPPTNRNKTKQNKTGKKNAGKFPSQHFINNSYPITTAIKDSPL